mgnify:CR=1 FL=1
MVRYAKSAGVKVCSFVSAAVVAASAVVGLAFPAPAQALEPTWYTVSYTHLTLPTKA